MMRTARRKRHAGGGGGGGGGGGDSVFCLLGIGLSPYVLAYPWDDAIGFGASMAAPAAPPPTAALQRGAFSGGNSVVIFASDAGPIRSYAWSDAGFGVSISPPASPLANTRSAAVSAASDVAAFGGSIDPYLSAWKWDEATGFGAKLAAVSPTLPALDWPHGLSFSSLGDLAWGNKASPYVYAQPCSPTGFGVRHAAPSAKPNGEVNATVFSAGSEAIIAAGWVSPFINAWAWSGAGFGVKFANPASLPAWILYDIAFSPTGDFVIAAQADTPGFVIYPWDNVTGFGAKIAGPSTPGSSNNASAKFAGTGAAIFTGDASGTVSGPEAWAFSPIAGVGAKYATPIGVSGGVRSVAVKNARP